MHAHVRRVELFSTRDQDTLQTLGALCDLTHSLRREEGSQRRKGKSHVWARTKMTHARGMRYNCGKAAVMHCSLTQRALGSLGEQLQVEVGGALPGKGI
jgi:hypothetical protein